MFSDADRPPAPHPSDWRILLKSPGFLHLTDAPESLRLRLAIRFALADARRCGDGEGEGSRVTLLVAHNDRHMATLRRMVPFFGGGAIGVAEFPAWDCLAYDRISPHARLCGRRMGALALLRHRLRRPLLLLTTINALIQRTPPRRAVENAMVSLRSGAEIDFDALLRFLDRWGFRRVADVTEIGEYSLRGGLIDIHPPLSSSPLRLDFFGDRIEAIRRFDPVNQRSRAFAKSALLTPAREIPLDDDSIRRFRDAYSACFGVARRNAAYDAVSAGQRIDGLEQWLPFFHDGLETLFDHIPRAAVFLDERAMTTIAERHEDIVDLRRQRLAAQRSQDDDDAPPPLPEDSLYLNPQGFIALLKARRTRLLSAHRRPPASHDDSSHDDASHDDDDASPRLSLGAAAAPSPRRGVSSIADLQAHPMRLFAESLPSFAAAGRVCVLAAASQDNRRRLAEHLDDYAVPHADLDAWKDVRDLPVGTVGLCVLDLSSGFATPERILLSESDIFGKPLTKPRKKQPKERNDALFSEIGALSTGDLIVHREHGVGRFLGLKTIAVDGAEHDCFQIVYAEDAKLFVPVENGDALSRYGPDRDGIQLDRLGAAGWQSRKARIKKRLRDIAAQLIDVAAARRLAEGIVVDDPGEAYRRFQKQFPHEETEDQIEAIQAIAQDLASGRPMDRLICGDVGFGKTEAALRAACLVALSGRQTALIAPTTLLARQHHRLFLERFAQTPVRIAALSRMTGPAAGKIHRRRLKDGEIDVVIGTHALLNPQIAFKDLGLVIIDEEQRFGVRHKERLKNLRAETHILTLTATPIPRTLQSAVAGVRDLSLIRTPPADRLAVRTFVAPFDIVTARRALLREYERNGKSLIVCPRIRDIAPLHEAIARHVPELDVAVIHGDMNAAGVEEIMENFYSGKRHDALIATTIVESGLDIPNADTLIVTHAYRFGLAQLHQLRGRIGRGARRGYAYFTYPADRKLSPQAEKRLDILQSLDKLGSGFALAAHDLDLRGAGNLLGEEQSGHVREVGVELYQHMLAEAVEAMKNRRRSPDAPDDPPSRLDAAAAVHLGLDTLIPDRYVGDIAVRLGLYRRLSRLDNPQALEDFKDELHDRFGEPPVEIDNLLAAVALKNACAKAGVTRIDAGAARIVVAFHPHRHPRPQTLAALIERQPDALRMRSDHRLVFNGDLSAREQRLKTVQTLIDDLAAQNQQPQTADLND